MKYLAYVAVGSVLIFCLTFAAYEGLDRLFSEYPELMEEGNLVQHFRF